MVKRRFLCSLLCCSPCCVVLALVGANTRFVGANAMFATFAPRILWFAQRNLWLAPPNAGFAIGILSKTHQSSLSINGGIFSKITPSLFTIKEGSTSHLGLLPSGEKRKPLLLVARNHFILWLADHQRSTPAAELRFSVCDRMDKGERNGCRKPKKPTAARPDAHEAHSNTP